MTRRIVNMRIRNRKGHRDADLCGLCGGVLNSVSTEGNPYPDDAEQQISKDIISHQCQCNSKESTDNLELYDQKWPRPLRFLFLTGVSLAFWTAIWLFL